MTDILGGVVIGIVAEWLRPRKLTEKKWGSVTIFISLLTTLWARVIKD
ncbi:MAG: hypothetical protein ACKVOJ_01285 [Sphingomonadaceae bacterium]